MAKHKSQRALFELLSQERNRQKASPNATPPKGGAETAAAPSPSVRGGAAKPDDRREPPTAPLRTAPTVVTRKVVLSVGGLHLQTYHLVIVGIVVVCLLYLFYLLGARFGGPGDGLPDVPARPTMDDIQGRQPEQNLVGPGPREADLGRRVEPEPQGVEPTPAEGTTETGRETGPTEPEPQPEPEPTPTGPQFRVRIARLDVSQPGAVDELRAFLARSGIETDLVTRGGYHVLYSRTRFADKTKADQLVTQVNKTLGSFERETGRPTSKDAYTVQIKGE